MSEVACGWVRAFLAAASRAWRACRREQVRPSRFSPASSAERLCQLVHVGRSRRHVFVAAPAPGAPPGATANRAIEQSIRGRGNLCRWNAPPLPPSSSPPPAPSAPPSASAPAHRPSRRSRWAPSHLRKSVNVGLHSAVQIPLASDGKNAQSALPAAARAWRAARRDGLARARPQSFPFAFCFPHRAFAAFSAISLRRFVLSFSARRLPPIAPPIRPISDNSSGERFSARALPPLAPPSLPSATACGFFAATSIA